MKRVIIALLLLAFFANAGAQGGPWKWPFPTPSGEWPRQDGAHRQYQWENDYLRINHMVWWYTAPDGTEDNFFVQLTNKTDEVLEATILLQHMGIEVLVTLPPHSTDHYAVGRFVDVNALWAFLERHRVHLFVRVNMEQYHFSLGMYLWKPGVWNAPGGGFLEHSNNYGDPRPSR